MLRALLMTATLSLPARAEVVLLDIEGMSCVSCEAKVKTALNALEFLSRTDASTPNGKACAELTGALDTPALTAAIEGLGYSVRGQDLLEACPDVHATPRRGNWSDTDGLDARIISSGETADIEAARVAGKFTVIDFGADWCAPCHAAEHVLKMYLAEHADTAVRAVVLAGRSPKESFAQPIVRQHLAGAPGLPFFIVYDPEGRVIYKGVSVAKVLQKIDRKR
jgi:copper chaperone CopZ